MLVVTIIRPKSAYLRMDKDQEDLTLEWSTNEEKQVAYEILYKRKEKTAWNTTGKIESNTTTFSLEKLFNFIGKEHLVEFHYRVLLYYDRTIGAENRTGKEYSDVYSIMFSPGYTKTLNSFDNGKKVSYPLFEGDTIPNTKDFNFHVPTRDKNLKVPLVNENSPLAGSFRVKTEDGIKSFATNEPKFQPSKIYHNGYFSVRAYIMTPLYTPIKYANYSYTTGTMYSYTGYNLYSYRDEPVYSERGYNIYSN